jgi:hypothetical protein
MKAVTYMLMLDHRFSVTSHFPRGNECCYGRDLIGFRQARCVSAQTPRLPVRVFLGFPFSLDGVFSCSLSSRGVYRHAFQEAEVPGRALRV